MKFNRTMQRVVLAASLLGGVAMVAAQVNPGRHPHLAAAQRDSQAAFNELVQAQQANSFDLGGHAQKAKDLLEQANRELELAAQQSNRNGRR